MNEMYPREKLFLPAGSAALRRRSRRRGFSPDVLVVGRDRNIAPLGFEHLVAAPMEFKSAAPYTWFWWVGVEIFFVISGFVIANSASKSTPSEFLLGRALQALSGGVGLHHASFIVLLVFASDKHPGTSCPTSAPCCSSPRDQGPVARRGVLDAGGGDGVLRAGVLRDADEERHAAARGLRPHHLERGVQPVSVLVLTHVSTTSAVLGRDLMFRVPGATWLLNHGCFFALGIWLFMSANRKLTTSKVAVAVTCLSGAAEIYYFASFMLTACPPSRSSRRSSRSSPGLGGAIHCARRQQEPACDRNAFARRLARSAGLFQDARPDHLSVLPDPQHHRVGRHSRPVRCRPRRYMAVWTGLALLALFCWFTCAKIEPAVRGQLKTAIANARRLPKAVPAASLPKITTPASWGTPAANFPGQRKLRGAAA